MRYYKYQISFFFLKKPKKGECKDDKNDKEKLKKLQDQFNQQ